MWESLSSREVNPSSLMALHLLTLGTSWGKATPHPGMSSPVLPWDGGQVHMTLWMWPLLCRVRYQGSWCSSFPTKAASVPLSIPFSSLPPELPFQRNKNRNKWKTKSPHGEITYYLQTSLINNNSDRSHQMLLTFTASSWICLSLKYPARAAESLLKQASTFSQRIRGH